MKKVIFLTLLMVGLGFLLNSGNSVFAVIELENPLNASSFEDVVNNIIDFVFYIGMALVPLGIVISAFYFFTATGDTNQVSTAKKILLYTLLGLAILLLAKALGSLLTTLLK